MTKLVWFASSSVAENWSVIERPAKEDTSSTFSRYPGAASVLLYVASFVPPIETVIRSYARSSCSAVSMRRYRLSVALQLAGRVRGCAMYSVRAEP